MLARVGALLALTCTVAQAQDFPNRPIRMVTFLVGGPSDVQARTLFGPPARRAALLAAARPETRTVFQAFADDYLLNGIAAKMRVPFDINKPNETAMGLKDPEATLVALAATVRICCASVLFGNSLTS